MSHAQSITIASSRPHFTDFFTQGLIIKDNIVWESSGGYGKSLLTQWHLKTGKILKQTKIDDQYFAEGLTELDNRLFMLTWKAGVAFEIDIETLATIKEHHYQGEGWGLTTDGKQLIMSNGSDVIQFIDPQTFAVLRTIRVHSGETSIPSLNELEWIENKIWANVYGSDYIIIIDPQTGSVVQRLHFPNLAKNDIRKPGVLNGIAYDKVQKKTWITGKNWSLLFEL